CETLSMFVTPAIFNFGSSLTLVSLSDFFSLLSFPAVAASAPHILSLHDALPIFSTGAAHSVTGPMPASHAVATACSISRDANAADRKSTRLNSSHRTISYAVFCLKKKKNKHQEPCHVCVVHQ